MPFRKGRTRRAADRYDRQPLQPPMPVGSMIWRETSTVAIDETPGASSAASTAFVGGFNHVWIGQRLDVRIQLLQERYADLNQVAWLVAARVVLSQHGSVAVRCPRQPRGGGGRFSAALTGNR